MESNKYTSWETTVLPDLSENEALCVPCVARFGESSKESRWLRFRCLQERRVETICPAIQMVFGFVRSPG